MWSKLFQLTVLFFVIFDPFISFSAFLIATKNLPAVDKRKTGVLSVVVAAVISLLFLLFGQHIFTIFDMKMEDFKIGAGIILGILGIKMTLGQSITNMDHLKDNASAKAIASIIGTPLLTGPAAITTIIVSVHDYGMLITGASVGIVLVLTALLFLFADRIYKLLGLTTIQVISTILGLITISWGVKFIRTGLGI
jgi:multiple antibiotic resistance protein